MAQLAQERERRLELAISIAKAEQTRDPEELKLLADHFATRFGSESTDDLVDRLARAANDDDAIRTRAFIARALVRLADPEAKLAISRSFSSVGLPAAALLLIGGPDTTDRLLRLATIDTRHNFGTGQLPEFACGLLRSDAPERVRPRVAAVLAERKDSGELHLRALLASLDYAQSLKDPADRAAYIDFERRLWWWYALAEKNHISGGWEYGETAGQLHGSWQEGDERFVRRIFDEINTTGTEVTVAMRLVVNGRLTNLKVDLEQLVANKAGRHEAAARVLSQLEERIERSPARVGGIPSLPLDSPPAAKGKQP